MTATSKKFYLTAAIPYVNAKPHIGHALEFVQGDAIRRAKQLEGFETLYLSGADEHALKNVQAAEKVGLEVGEFCKQNAEKFQAMAKHLDVHFDVFQRASNPEHHASCKLLWEKCAAAGDIYKKTYEGLYCVGCETYYAPEELNEKGECFEHPGKKLELLGEENYFFKLSKYAKQIESLIEKDELLIQPAEKKNEILGFLKGDVQDISISRSKERAKNWGVQVPNDPAQVMYVWFDALNVYQSGVGFGHDDATYNKWWPADAHLIGKGISRFHAVYWIAMLLSAKLALPKSILVHGYFTVNGQKMSKTLGNVIDPEDVLQTYPADALRYYLLREISTTEDGDFSLERLHESYTVYLANELGNLVSRTAKLCEGFSYGLKPAKISQTIFRHVNEFNIKLALDLIWENITKANKILSESKPWEKTGDERKTMLKPIVESLVQIGADLQPFMPSTATTITTIFTAETISAATPLFPRIK